MLDILSVLPGKKRKTPSGWWSFNGVCCTHLGHSRDTRGRAGIKFADGNNWNYHCFNCQFKCSFFLGRTFSDSLKQLLSWCGVDQAQIQRWSLHSFSQRTALQDIEYQRQNQEQDVIKFDHRPLPPGARLITQDPADQVACSYLQGRGFSVDDYPFYTVDGESRPRIILPYFYKGKIVGNTSRFYDGRHPKYLSEQAPGFVFNIDAQHPEWEVCILVEGQFDALSIGGCAYMGSNISDDQARLISRLHRKVIVVPDRDKAGLEIVQRALDLEYHVSIPNWGPDVKDVNDAVLKYGRLPTLLSIIQSATKSKIKIEMARKKIT